MGVKKEYDTLGSLPVQFGIPVISITFFDIAEQYNDHGLLTFRTIVPEEVTQEDVLRCEDSPVTIHRQEGGVLFSGIATSLSPSHAAEYQEPLVIAKGRSVQADRQRTSKTFQSTGKTLAQVAHLVLDSCGVQVTIPQDMPLSQMLTRENETAREFIRRVATEQRLYVYADSKSLQPHISIGLEPFGVFPQDVVEVNSEKKNISDCFSIQYDTGSQISAFQAAKQQGYSPELLVAIGYKLSGGRDLAVVGSRNTNKGDLLVNRLTLTDSVGAIPVSGTQRLEFVLGREHTNPDHFTKTHISFKDGEGLIIGTEECLQLPSLQQNICLASRPKDWVDTSVKASKDAAFQTGLADYIGYGGGLSRAIQRKVGCLRPLNSMAI